MKVHYSIGSLFTAVFLIACCLFVNTIRIDGFSSPPEILSNGIEVESSVTHIGWPLEIRKQLRVMRMDVVGKSDSGNEIWNRKMFSDRLSVVPILINCFVGLGCGLGALVVSKILFRNIVHRIRDRPSQ